MKNATTKTICEYCKKEYLKETYDFKRTKRNFCSKKCRGLADYKRIHINCFICNKPIEVKISELKRSKSGKSFCSRSCAAIYNNKLKRRSCRSKIEIKFYNLLVKEFSNLNILANDKTMLGGLETDIAIPSLKLAIEWNGIVHFKPIYGTKTLNKIKNRDKEKLKIAANKDINLIVISDLTSRGNIINKSLQEVSDIINNLLAEERGNDPPPPKGGTL